MIRFISLIIILFTISGCFPSFRDFVESNVAEQVPQDDYEENQKRIKRLKRGQNN